jgi:hypothetical protein
MTTKLKNFFIRILKAIEASQAAKAKRIIHDAKYGVRIWE